MHLLLSAAPDTAVLEDEHGRRPLHLALEGADAHAAHALLPASGLSASQLLDAMQLLPAYWPAADEAMLDRQPLYIDLATCFALSADEWQRVPAPCAGLGRALPAVLARSVNEVRQLVQHLPEEDQQRLHTAALCLSRAQRCHGTFMPAPLVRTILAQCLL